MTEKIKSIQDRVRQVDPLLLLSLCNKVAAWEQVAFKDIPSLRMPPGLVRAGEYLQSVVVATEGILSDDQPSMVVDLCDLLKDVKDLYSDASIENIKRDFLYEDKSLTTVQRAAVMTMQNMYNVRGKRDASFQHHFHDFLIRPHDEIFRRTYGVSAEHIVEGLDRLLDSTRRGMIQAYVDGEVFCVKEFYSLNDLPSREKLIDLFDVRLVTQWPQELIEDLSFGPGDDTSFYKGDFAGSPEGDLPIKDRPFVKITGRIYAFSYYILADYFYRALQCCIEYRCPQYDWSHPQASAMEAEAKRIFNRLLPNAEILTNNHYHPENNPNLEGENDLIVSLGDVVIIVEVKGRKRWHSPPCWNSKAFLKGNFNDIKAAIEQCRKTERYINMSLNPVFYDSTWTQKKVLDVSGCRFMLKLVVVLDGINEITSSLSSLRGVWLGRWRGEQLW